jgi:hypothetical protein
MNPSHLFERSWMTLVVAFVSVPTSPGQRPDTVEQEIIEGVQAVSLDQPRIYMNVRRDADDDDAVLETGTDADTGESVSAIEAFLDTGASGIMLSTETASALGVQSETSADGQPVVFHDVGIGGSEAFSVAEPLRFATVPYASNRSGESRGAYLPPVGPIRAQIKAQGGGLLELLAPGGLDVAGMPIMLGKVVVIDPKPLADFDLLRTSIFEPGDRQIPETTVHVPLTYVSFAWATRTEPQGAAGPNLAPNPMIGPDPFAGDSRDVQPVTLHHGDHAVTGTFLLDTGAAASMISTRVARELGLELPRDQKFDLAVGGMGGGKQAPGVVVDRLELPVIDGSPVTYVNAPFLVLDITVAAGNGQTYTLDGVIGMNFLVASAEVTGGLLPDIGNIVDGPFRWIVINHDEGWLGLSPR